MGPLTSEYVNNHRINIHSYDSFGRSVADLLLKSASEQLQTNSALGEKGVIKFSAEVAVAAFEPMGCTMVTVSTPLGTITMHAGG